VKVIQALGHSCTQWFSALEWQNFPPQARAVETESIPAPAGSRFLTRIIHIIGLMVVLLTAFSYAFVPLRESQDE